MAGQNNLTNFEYEKGNIWLKHTFYEVVNDNLFDAYAWDYAAEDFENVRPDFMRLYTFISNKSWDENEEMDAILNRVALIAYSDRVLGNLHSGEKIIFTAEQIARILINMCYNAKIFWDNGSHTKQEKEYFEKTIFGKVINDLDCYLIPDANINQQATQPSQSAGTKPQRQPGQQNPWRARGPLSDQARGLVGQPHQKIFDNNQIYKIVDANSSGKEIHAIVRTLNPKGDAGNNVNRVFISNSNNYGDSLCLFTDINEANEFLNKAQQVYTTGTLTLKQAKKDPNGYFRVKTAFGECLILADGLNEEIEEELIEATTMVNPCKKLTDEELAEARSYNAN